MFKPFLGALEDTRPRKEREKDFLFKEIVATTTPVTWQEREPRQFPIRDQDGSGACVAFSLAKLAGIIQQTNHGGRFVDFSPAFVYQRRANKNIGDGQGMHAIDAWNILRKDGITLDPLMPSDDLTEAQINALPEQPVYRDVAKLFKIDNYVSYTPMRDFDAIAGTIQRTGKGVMVWFRFDYSEWTEMPRARSQHPTLHHAVVAVDAVIHKGEQCLVIDDSWGPMFGRAGQRFITRDFFEKRNTHASYALSFKLDADELPRPRYRFTVPLRQGQTSVDIQALQDILKYEELFPSNVASSGFYGEITRRAVLAYQTKYQVASPAELAQVNGTIVGPKTLEHLNSKYS